MSFENPSFEQSDGSPEEIPPEVERVFALKAAVAEAIPDEGAADVELYLADDPSDRSEIEEHAVERMKLQNEIHQEEHGLSKEDLERAREVVYRKAA